MTQTEYIISDTNDLIEYHKMFPSTPRAKCYCPACNDMRVGDVYITNYIIHGSNSYRGESTIYVHKCLQCEHETILILHKVDDELTMTSVYSTNQAFDSNTVNKSVCYYMSEALRAESSGAYSASMAMYRATLDCLLYDQGFHEGMLGRKISEMKIKHPKWLDGIDERILTVIQKLGNESIHPNNGDIDLQKKFDRDLLFDVKLALSILIKHVYIYPAEERKIVERLSSKSLSS